MFSYASNIILPPTELLLTEEDSLACMPALDEIGVVVSKMLPSSQTIIAEQFAQGRYRVIWSRFKPVTLQLKGKEHTATLPDSALYYNMHNYNMNPDRHAEELEWNCTEEQTFSTLLNALHYHSPHQLACYISRKPLRLGWGKRALSQVAWQDNCNQSVKNKQYLIL